MVDPAFAKLQLKLLVREWYMKPDGQIPAYEWNFSDVNPPVHAWCVYIIFAVNSFSQVIDPKGDIPCI